jgi:DNA-directed RNA polymerase specialized sigma24 family protein
VESVPLKSRNRSKDWTLNAGAFHKLLSWLDEGRGSSGQAYLGLRKRLVDYFERKDCPAPEDLADETLNRVARRLEEEGTIESEAPARYCYIVARFVFMEDLRERQRYSGSSELPHSLAVRPEVKTEDEQGRLDQERMLGCLQHCMETLTSENRKLILDYYIGNQRVKIENRRAMAQRLGITVNAMSIRACRIREKLAGCVKQCVEAK